MQFVDEVSIQVHAGDGGNGCAAFRREKFLPLGGPAGGDGGKGGDIILRSHDRLSTLLDLRYQKQIRARRGEDGRGKDQYGAGGKPVIVEVPVGTQIFDEESGQLIIDLAEHEMEYVIARGGQGGRGNLHFATPHDRAPRRADPGEPGEHRAIRLELKLLADVGVIGFPNVGKSTLIATVSRARPKIADYPFTTLVPNLGVVSLGPERNFVMADIPGIIEGAHEGAGLGLRFLKHIERTRILLHVISFDPDPEREPLQDFERLMHELEAFHAELAGRPMMVAVSKLDLTEVREVAPSLVEAFEKRGLLVVPFSAATHEGVDELLGALEKLLTAHPKGGAPVEELRPTASERPHGDRKGRGFAMPEAENEDE